MLKRFQPSRKTSSPSTHPEPRRGKTSKSRRTMFQASFRHFPPGTRSKRTAIAQPDQTPTGAPTENPPVPTSIGFRGMHQRIALVAVEVRPGGADSGREAWACGAIITSLRGAGVDVVCGGREGGRDRESLPRSVGKKRVCLAEATSGDRRTRHHASRPRRPSPRRSIARRH